MAVLQQMPQHIAHLPKSGHDLSQNFGFTSSTGMLLPVYQDFLNPGETVSFNGNLYSRTQPIVTAAMADVDVYLDWFFVPASMLFTLFPSMMWQTDDRISDFYVDGLSGLPNIDINFSLYESATEGTMQTASLFNSADIYQFGDSIGKARFRLANHLGFNPFGVFDKATDSTGITNMTTNPHVFPLFPLAYQAIYEKHYRMEDREAFSPRWFNIDSFALDAAGSELSTDKSPFTLRYRPRRSDYFMSLKPSPIMSAVSLIGGTSGTSTSPGSILQNVDNWLTNVSSSSVNNTSAAANMSFTSAGTISSLGSGENGSFMGSVFTNIAGVSHTQNYLSPANIRSVFAVEKLLRITGRAAKNYDAQVLAHFGWKVPHDVKHELSFLGSDHGILHIGEVISDADTYDSSTNQGTALGYVGGKGYVSINGKNRKFTAPVHGVLMCIYSAVPRFRYWGGFDKQNAITDRLSFYQPEFDKLGMQPMFKYETDYKWLDTTIQEAGSVYGGWQFRYQQWKKKYDRVSVAFMNPSASGTVNQYSAWVLGSKPYLAGIYNSSTSDASPFLNSGSIDIFLSTPHDLDAIMVMPYSSGFVADYYAAPWLMFATDPFINDFGANVKKVSTMSPTGEPDLD